MTNVSEDRNYTIELRVYQSKRHITGCKPTKIIDLGLKPMTRRECEIMITKQVRRDNHIYAIVPHK